MGNSSITEENQNSFNVISQNIHIWRKQASLGYCQIVKNQLSGLIAESYIVPIIDYETQVAIYQFRKDSGEYPIVQTYSVRKIEEKILCAYQSSMKAIVERIPYRLIDLGSIGYPQGLYIMSQIIKGAKKIEEEYFKAFGSLKRSIKYNEDMICFNEKGEAKIWVSENLGSNKPCWKKINEEEFLAQIKCEEQNVLELMNLVEKRMSGSKFEQYLKQKQINKRFLSSYDEALRFLKEMNLMEENMSGKKTTHVLIPSMLLDQSRTTHFSINQERAVKKTRIFSKSPGRNIKDFAFESEESLIANLMTTSKSSAKPPRPPKSKSKQQKKEEINDQKYYKISKNILINPNSDQEKRGRHQHNPLGWKDRKITWQKRENPIEKPFVKIEDCQNNHEVKGNLILNEKAVKQGGLTRKQNELELGINSIVSRNIEGIKFAPISEEKNHKNQKREVTFVHNDFKINKEREINHLSFPNKIQDRISISQKPKIVFTFKEENKN